MCIAIYKQLASFMVHTLSMLSYLYRPKIIIASWTAVYVISGRRGILLINFPKILHMRIFRESAIVLGLSLLALGGYAQKYEAALNTLDSKHPSEKVYVHYDKSYYIAGETIWFKAYFYSNGMPSGLSTNFYMRLFDARGNAVNDYKFPILGAAAKGSIELPDSLPQGNYYLAGSTLAMMTYGSDFGYQKNFYIYNPSQKSSSVSSPAGLSVQFFPESGNLVAGVPTVVAFKATDKGGNPVDVSGVIKTDDGSTIASFKTYHDGMGKTNFRPQDGKKYIAEVDDNGTNVTFQLPPVQSSGIVLKIQDEKGGKLFVLARGDKDKKQFDNVVLVAEIRNKIVYENEIAFEDYPSVKGHLITDSLPSGILHFTVFTKEGMPLAERLSFVNNREYVSQAEITNTKANFSKKASNNVEISFPVSIQRSLSVAITDAGTNPNAVDESIWSAFLLTGDIRGHVNNASYYFNNQDDSTKLAIDNLLLTQGWSRYEWKKILANEFPSMAGADNFYLAVSGTVVKKGTTTGVNGGKLTLYMGTVDSTQATYEVNVGNDGRFVLDSVMFYGRSNFFYYYAGGQAKPDEVNVILDKDSGKQPAGLSFVSKPARAQMTGFMSASDLNSQFNWLSQYSKRVKELPKVTVQTTTTSKKPEDVVNDKYTTGAFRSESKAMIDNVTKPAGDRSGNALDYIKNRIQQIEFINNQFVSRKNMSIGSGQKWTVGVFIDEVPADANTLRTLRIDEIALVKYFDAGFVGASNSPGGALAVYTKRQDAAAARPAQKLESFSTAGYTVVKEFYSPDYSKGGTEEIDNRPTLYWNADLFTGADGKTLPISFYNNDRSKKFKVVVEGFDVSGKLVHVEKILE
jgi:hypothetical protein